MKKQIINALLLVFSFLFLYYPISYGFNFKVSLVFLLLIFVIYYILKKLNIKEKYYLYFILLFAIITRVGVVFFLNDVTTQVSDFEQALTNAQTNIFSGIYYQVFTHWIIYPKILHKLFMIFGSTQLVALLFNSVILILTSVLVYKNASLIFKDKQKGFYVSLIYIFWPANIFYTLIVTPEHICSLLLMSVLYLFLLLIKHKFFENKMFLTIVFSLVIGILLSLSSFFKNFSYVFIVAFLIYIILDIIKNKENNRQSLYLKGGALILTTLSMLITNNLIFNRIENYYVKAPIVRNTAPCYLNVGLRDNGVYSPENYQMYFDTFTKNDYDYKKTNKEILTNLKYHLTNEVTKKDIANLFVKKAEIIYGNDTSKLDFTSSSITDNTVADFLKEDVIKLNNIYFYILVFLSILGLYEMYKSKNLKLFLSYLIFYGALLLILIVEGQNRYMYALQTLMCINTVAGIKPLAKLLSEKIKVKPLKEKIKYNNKSLFYSGMFILLFIGINIMLASFMLIFKVPISRWYVGFSLYFSILIISFLLKKNNYFSLKNILVAIVLPIMVIFASINVAGKFFDRSWDGNMYHKAAIGYLIEGWNPLEESVKEFDERQDVSRDLVEWSYLWMDHYPKASYLYGANISIITGNIESGKSINLLTIYATFVLVLSLLLHLKKEKGFAILFSLLVVTCTTIGSQYLTNFIDLLVYLYFFLLIWYFFANEEKEYASKLELYICYFIILVLLINIKFSSFGYAGIMCLGFYIWYIFRFIKKKISKKEFWQFTGVSALAVVIGVFVVGLSSYPMNFLKNGHPFYPIYGENKREIMTQETLEHLIGEKPVKKFFISNFSKALNSARAQQDKAELKIPFTISEEELKFVDTYNIRIAGNGLLFSGILVISSLCYFILLIGEFFVNKKKFIMYLIPTIVTIILIFILDDIWWARYFPQIHLIVFGSMLLLEQKKDLAKNYILQFLMIVTFINNNISLFSNTLQAIKSEQLASAQIEDFKSKYTPDKCKMKIYSLVFPGGYFNLEEELPEYEKEYTSKELNVEYQYILNSGYAAGICEEVK